MFNRASVYKKRSRESFDRQAIQYDVSSDGEHARTIYPHALERLSRLPYHSVLDVGCGTGQVLSKIVPREGLALAGIDLSPQMIGMAQQKLGERADVRVGDAEELPWPDNSFDVVLCLDAFHHYPHPRKALAEMWRVAKSAGRLILGDLWQPAPVRQLMNCLMPLTGGGDVRVYSQKEMCALLNESGFTAIQWELVNESAYVVTAMVL